MMESKGRVGNRSSRDLVVRLPDHLMTQLTVGKLLSTEGKHWVSCISLHLLQGHLSHQEHRQPRHQSSYCLLARQDWTR